jgi:hypothetical protein
MARKICEADPSMQGWCATNYRDHKVSVFHQRESTMGILGPYMLASMIAGLVLPAGIADAQSPTVSIETEYLMTFEAPLDPAQVVGPHVIFNVPAGDDPHQASCRAS